mgnify:CR=1 FL=1
MDEWPSPSSTADGDQPQARVLAPGQGGRLAALAEPATLKAGQADTGGAFELMEASLAPYWDAGRRHRHARQSEVVYVLEGTLAVTLGDTTLTVRRGGCVVIPPGLAHVYWNPTGAAVALLVIAAPAGREHLNAALAAASADGALTPGQRLDLAAQHDEFSAPAPR